MFNKKTETEVIEVEAEEVIEEKVALSNIDNEVEGFSEFIDNIWDRVVNNDILAGRDAQDLLGDLWDINEQIEWAKKPSLLDKIPFISEKFWSNREWKQKSFNGKMNEVFKSYEAKMGALVSSITDMEEYKEWLMKYYDVYVKSIEWVNPEALTDEAAFEYTQRCKSITATETSINRIEIRLSDTKKIVMGMRHSLPRYKQEMKGAIIEIGAGKRLSDWLKVWSMFEEKATKTQFTLTSWVIESNRETNITWQSVMNSDKIKANSQKLLWAMWKMDGSIKALWAWQ